MGARARQAWRTAALTAGAVVLLGAGAAALALYLAPRVLPNLTSTGVEEPTVRTVEVGTAAASVVVPEGWAYQRPVEGDGELIVRSPDGELAVTVTVAGAGPEAAFRALVDDLHAPMGAPAREILASGAQIRHATTPDDTMLVAVISGDTGPTALLTAEAEAIDAYRPALAELFDTVIVGAAAPADDDAASGVSLP